MLRERGSDGALLDGRLRGRSVPLGMVAEGSVHGEVSQTLSGKDRAGMAWLALEGSEGLGVWPGGGGDRGGTRPSGPLLNGSDVFSQRSLDPDYVDGHPRSSTHRIGAASGPTPWSHGEIPYREEEGILRDDLVCHPGERKSGFGSENPPRSHPARRADSGIVGSEFHREVETDSLFRDDCVEYLDPAQIPLDGRHLDFPHALRPEYVDGRIDLVRHPFREREGIAIRRQRFRHPTDGTLDSEKWHGLAPGRTREVLTRLQDVEKCPNREVGARSYRTAGATDQSVTRPYKNRSVHGDQEAVNHVVNC